jgi:hypothetical protein
VSAASTTRAPGARGGDDALPCARRAALRGDDAREVKSSNKEIANVLSVTMRNIETHRHWIRKAQGLASDVDLSAYLAAQ